MNNYTPPYTITSKIVNLISQISEEIGKIEVNRELLASPKLRKVNRIKTIAGTLEIEGNFLGEEKITAILEGKRVLGSYEEITEAEGAIEAYRHFEKYDYKKIDDLLLAHKLMMGQMLKSAGSFRKINVGVGSKEGVTHIAPQASLVAGLMEQLFEWLSKSDEHPLIKSSVFHYEFEFIHPFSDGNGRIGRLWQSLILYSWKKEFGSMPIESIIRDNQEEYYKAIEESSQKGESTPFIEFMLEVILQTLKEVKRENVPRSVPKNVPLKRLEMIIEQIKKNRNITIAELANILNVSDKTIKRDIAKLKQENKIARVGSLKSGYWEIKE